MIYVSLSMFSAIFSALPMSVSDVLYTFCISISGCSIFNTEFSKQLYIQQVNSSANTSNPHKQSTPKSIAQSQYFPLHVLIYSPKSSNSISFFCQYCFMQIYCLSTHFIFPSWQTYYYTTNLGHYNSVPCNQSPHNDVGWIKCPAISDLHRPRHCLGWVISPQIT